MTVTDPNVIEIKLERLGTMTHHEHLVQADRLIADCVDRSPDNARSSEPSMNKVCLRM
jgi:hypothetical protein